MTPATIIDHLIALSLGGDDRDENLVPACRACNSEKAGDEMRYLARGNDPVDLWLDPFMKRWRDWAANTP